MGYVRHELAEIIYDVAKMENISKRDIGILSAGSELSDAGSAESVGGIEEGACRAGSSDGKSESSSIRGLEGDSRYNENY